MSRSVEPPAARLRLRRDLPLAAILAAATDLGVAALRGYVFRTDAVILVAANVAAAAVLSSTLLTVLWALSRTAPLSVMSRAPRTCIAAAAIWPVLFQHAYRTEQPLWLLPDLAATAILAVCGLVEIRRASRAPRLRLRVGIVVLSSSVVALSISPRLPGSSLLGPPRPGPVATPEHPNLILIVLDTLGAGHLGPYGYPRPVSPWLDEFVAGSFVFDRAVSSSSWTLPAHATLFTGLYPRAHGADLDEDPELSDPREALQLAGFSSARPLAAEATTLAEIASRAGLETAAICANNSFLHHFFGLDQGFRSYVDVLPTRAAAEPAGIWFAARVFRGLRWLANGNSRVYLLASEVNALALRWLEPRRDRRFFLFLNYMDTHDPYLPSGKYRRLFPAAWPPASIDEAAIRARRREILPSERASIVDRYDAQIRYLDDQLRALFDRLESWELLQSTLVVIVGDHGESFGEHNDLGHGNGVYETEVRVPLIVRLPNQTEGARVEHVVHLVDILPTVLHEMALTGPPEPQGGSLFDSDRIHPPVAYTARFPHMAERYPGHLDRTHHAVYDDPWKLIQRSDGEIELYDIRSDPRELSNQADHQPDLVRRLQESLAEFESEVRPRFGRLSPPRDPALMERLRALGYVR